MNNLDSNIAAFDRYISSFHPSISYDEYRYKYKTAYKYRHVLKKMFEYKDIDSKVVQKAFDIFPYFERRYILEEFKSNVNRMLTKKLHYNSALSIACGPLIYESFYLIYGYIANIVAIDISQTLIEKGISFFGNHHNLITIAKNFDTVELTKQFDLIYCLSALHWFRDPPNTIKRIIDLATENTHIYITTYPSYWGRSMDGVVRLCKRYGFKIELSPFYQHDTGCLSNMLILTYGF